MPSFFFIAGSHTFAREPICALLVMLHNFYYENLAILTIDNRPKIWYNITTIKGKDFVDFFANPIGRKFNKKIFSNLLTNHSLYGII